MAMEMQQKRKSSACGWDSEATRALINIWGQTDVQSKLDSVKRNRDIFLKVSRDLQDLGYNWTWEQCRTKIKNLTQKYRKVKDSNRVTGQGRSTCPFYEEIDAILGTRAASIPPTLLESSSNTDDTDGCVDWSVLRPQHSPADTEDHQDEDTTGGGGGASDDPVIESADNRGSLNPMPTPIPATERNKALKRKRSTKSSTSSELTTIICDMEEKAEERELKRMKLEAEIEEKKRQEERKHEERMQTMMMGFMTQMMNMVSPPSFPHSSTSYLPPSYPPPSPTYDPSQTFPPISDYPPTTDP